jgi:hypothetical protein
MVDNVLIHSPEAIIVVVSIQWTRWRIWLWNPQDCQKTES